MFSALFVPALFVTAVIFNILISLFVYIRNPRSATHIIYFFLGIVISVWLSIHFLSARPFSNETNLILIRVSIMFAALMEMLFLLLALTLPSNKFHFNKVFILGLTILTSVVMSVAVSPFAFISVAIVNNFPNPQPGPGIAIFGIFVLLLIISSASVLYQRSRKVIGTARKQLRYLMLGILLMNGLMIFTVLLPVNLLHDNRFVTLAPFYTLLFLSVTAYTIIRHKLMDLRLVVARTVAYVLLLTVLGLIYVGLIFGVTNFLLPQGKTSINLLIYSVLALLIAVTAQPLREVTNRATQKIFFKNDYDEGALLARLTKILATKIDLQEVSSLTLRELITTTGITDGSYFIFHNDKETQFIFEGMSYEKINSLNQKYNPSVKEWFSKLRNSIFFADEENENIKQLMTELEIEAIIPLLVGESFQGLLLLGGKKTGEIYSDKDVNLLKIFGPEVSVAIENSKAYEEIKRFNVTLKQEVDRQTKDLQIANERLQDLDKLKDEFVSLASHELRTPMTIIKSYVWMLLNRKADMPPEKEKTYLERAYESTQRLINLVNDMLNVSRIESGRLKLEKKDLDLVGHIERIVGELSPRAKQLNLSLNLIKPQVPMKHILADQDRIEQILINLIGNSFKFTPPGGRIDVSITPQDSSILVSIKDNGKGMDNMQMSALFQKFATMGGNYLTKENIQGTGLGLYISKSLVELHGGKISASSDGPGKGSTFSFTLPYSEVTQNENHPKAAGGFVAPRAHL